jgi:hypothetical protein
MGAGGVNVKGSMSASPPLVNTLEFAQCQPAPVRATIFSRFSRERVRRSAIAIERIIGGPENCVFLTGTFPYSGPAAAAIVGAESGWIVKRVKNWLRFLGPESLDFYVWERHKNGSLHLHYCVASNEAADRERLVQNFKTFWCETIKSLSKRTGRNLFIGKNGQDWSQRWEVIRADAQICRKSVGRYMSKYLSKTASGINALVEKFAIYPRRWWGCSQSTKNAIESLTTETRKPFPGWLQSRNHYLRLVEDLTSTIPWTRIFQSRSLDCDADSTTFYLGSDQSINLRELVEMTVDKKIIRPRENNYAAIRTDWARETIETCLRLKIEIREKDGKSRCFQSLDWVLTSLISIARDSGQDPIESTKAMCVLIQDLDSRIKKQFNSGTYEGMLRAKSAYDCVYPAVFRVWANFDRVRRLYAP